MKEQNDIQKMAKVMLSSLLIGAMFSAPTATTHAKQLTTQQIKLNRILPHYSIKSKGLHKLINSHSGFDVSDDADSLNTDGLFSDNNQQAYYYLPANGFLKSNTDHLFGKTRPNTTLAMYSGLSDIRPYGKSGFKAHHQNNGSDSDLDNFCAYIQSKATSKTITFSEKAYQSMSVGKPSPNTPNTRPATFTDRKYRNKIFMDPSQKIISITYRVHNAIGMGHQNEIVLYPYKETQINGKAHSIPLSVQERYPLILHLHHHIAVQKAMHATKRHKRTEIHRHHATVHHKHKSFKIHDGATPDV